MLGFSMTPNTASSQGTAPAKGPAAERGSSRDEQVGEGANKRNFMAFFNAGSRGTSAVEAADTNATANAEADGAQAVEDISEADSVEVADEGETSAPDDDETEMSGALALMSEFEEHADQARGHVVANQEQTDLGQSLQAADPEADVADGEGVEAAGDATSAIAIGDSVGARALQGAQNARHVPADRAIQGIRDPQTLPMGGQIGQPQGMTNRNSSALDAPTVTGATQTGGAFSGAQLQPGTPVAPGNLSLLNEQKLTLHLTPEAQSAANAHAEGNARHAPDDLATALARAANDSGEASARVGTPAFTNAAVTARAGENLSNPALQMDVSSSELGASDDFPSQTGFGLQASGAEARVQSLTAQHDAAMPRSVAAQMIVALEKGADRPIDVILNPAELGRVRITLSQSDAGMIVNVAAERAETLDLMRRNSDMLGREFSDLGYDGTEFTFDRDGGRQGGNAEPDAHGQQAEVIVPVDAPTTLINLRAAPADRLDIRL